MTQIKTFKIFKKNKHIIKFALDEEVNRWLKMKKDIKVISTTSSTPCVNSMIYTIMYEENKA